MKSYLITYTSLALASGLLQAGPSQLVNEPFLAAIRAEAARAHPSAHAGKQKAIAAAQDVRTTRLWNDPMVGLGFMAADRMMRESDGDLSIGIEQVLPKPGLYAAELRKAEAMHRAELENSRTSTLSVGAEAARAAIELALADDSVALQQFQLTWLAAMVENARQMAADPMRSSADALRMETELAKETQTLNAARRSRDAFAQRLNLILGRSLDSPWPPLQLPTSPPPSPVAQAEIARIPFVNPKVRAMAEMVGAANAETRIADRERLPEVSVGVDTNLYSQGEFRSAFVGLKLTLPWFNEISNQAKVDAAKSRENAAGSEVEAMRREIAASVLTAATEAANAAAQARAYSGEIRDKARLAQQTIEAAWISSKAPLTDLLDSSRTLFGIQLEHHRQTAMQLAALEELRILVPNR
jgi:outer membrane protein TolC